MKTYFKGYYGQRNTGDDAFCSVAAWACKKYWHVERPCFLSSELSETTVPVDLAFKKNAMKGSDKIQAAFLPLKSKSRLVFAGGSVLHSINGVVDPNWFYKVYSSIGMMELAAVGVSIGPFTSSQNEKAIKKFLNKFTYLAVRDAYSYKWAVDSDIDCKVVHAGDIAGLLPLVYPQCVKNQKTNNNSPILGVSLCRYDSYKENGDLSAEREFEKKITNAICMIAAQSNIKLRFFIFNGNHAIGDMAVTEDVIKKLAVNHVNYEIVPYSNDPGITLKKISECSAVFAIRLHAAIFSHVTGVPFMLYEYHRKCSDYLDDIGMPSEHRVHGSTLASEITEGLLGMIYGSNFFLSVTPQDMIESARKSFISAPWYE